MREDIEDFRAREATVAAIAPDDADGVARFTRDSDYPFPLLADSDHAVFDAYDVASKLISLGQRPAVFVVDAGGVVRFDAVGSQQWDIPANDRVLSVLDGL